MEYVVGPIWSLLDLIAIIMFSSSFLKKREHSRKQIVCFLVIWVASSIYSNLGISSVITLFLNTLTTFLLLSALFYGKWMTKILCTILSHLYLGTIDVAVTYGFCAILGISYAEFVWKKLMYITVISMGKLLEILFAYIILRLRRTGGVQSVKNKWTVLTILFPAISLIMLAAMVFNSQNTDDLSIGVFVFCCILTIANIAILYLIRIMEKRSSDEHQLALMDQQMEIQTHNIIALEKSYRAQRQASHEFNHQMQAITQLLSRKEYAEAEKYLHEIQGYYSVRTFAVNSHHPILDAIFNQKYQTACEQEIDMTFSLNDLSSVKIKANQLVVLFSNLLDNALEACVKCEGEKVIQCRIEKTTCLYVSIRNTSPSVNIANNQIETTKMSKSEHGYGLKNVQRILNELHAEYTFDYSNGWFHFVAEIPLSDNS